MAEPKVLALRPAEPGANDRDRQVTATLTLVGNADTALAEATALPEVRRVMEVATVAAEAARRVARLAESQDAPSEMVEAANEAANQASALRIEAQARAGEMLAEMAAGGKRERQGGDRAKSHAATLVDLAISKSESSRWQRVAAIPAEIRRGYATQVRAGSAGLTTAGLLRYAAQIEGERGDETAEELARREMRRVYRLVAELPRYDPAALAAALDGRERRRLASTLAAVAAWVEEVRGELATYGLNEHEEER